MITLAVLTDSIIVNVLSNCIMTINKIIYICDRILGTRGIYRMNESEYLNGRNGAIFVTVHERDE